MQRKQTSEGLQRPKGKEINKEGLKRKRAEEELQSYKFMVESAHDAIFFKDLDSRYVIANAKTLESFGLSREEVVGKNDYELLVDQEEAKKNIEDDQIVFRTGKPREITKHMTRPNGKEYWFEAIKVPRADDKGNIIGLVGIARDVSERKRAEEALRKREAELEAQSYHLEEVNTALKVLLKQRENDKKELEDNVLSNVRQLVNPHLQRLKKSRLDADQKTLVSILESNLINIVSPFVSRLSSKFLHLTPMEIRVAEFIKEGKTNKEIGELLCVSPNTVRFHRNNVRNKLGLKEKKANLRSHLLSLTK